MPKKSYNCGHATATDRTAALNATTCTTKGHATCCPARDDNYKAYALCIGQARQIQ